MKHISLIVLTFLQVSLYSQSKPLEIIPFKLENNSIYIYCKVNETDSLKFIFDTGANGSVINMKSIEKLQLKISGKTINTGSNGKNEVDESYNNEVSIGNIHKKNIRLSIIAYDTDEFDGVLGTDVMIGSIIEIDYHKQVLNFYDNNDKSINYNGYVQLKMYSEIYPTCIKASVIHKGKKYKGLFGIDTGANDVLTISSPFAKNNDFANKMINIGTSTSQGSDGSINKKTIVLCEEVEFANKQFYRIPASLSTAKEGIDSSDKLAGFYGNSFLKKFNTIIDYENHFIYFKINKNLYLDFYEE